jgi:hypothetical protein
MRYMLQPPGAPSFSEEFDEHFKNAVELVVNYERASASLLQRRLSIGYARAARIIDQLEQAGVLGPAEGAEPREVLIKSASELFGDTEVKQKDGVKDPFDNIFFWIKVVKVSLVILIPYWLFGFEAALIVGIIFISLFLSKISLSLQEINIFFRGDPRGKPNNKVSPKHSKKPESEGQLIV